MRRKKNRYGKYEYRYKGYNQRDSTKKSILIGAVILIISLLVITIGLLYLSGYFKWPVQTVPTPTEQPTPEPTEQPMPTPEPPEQPLPTPEPTEQPTPEPIAELFNGELELPVNGATGYASVTLNMRSAPDSSSALLRTFAPGDAFIILREEGSWWEISVDGVTGWVYHPYCMINLPDVIPSIIYNSTNTYSSVFVTSGLNIPNITGEALYFGKTYNERLENEEFIVAVMYSMSKRIWQAQRYAMENGETLVIYEGFRPYSVQMKVANELIAFANANPEANAGLNASPWRLNWFIATGLSTHQTGCAIDVSLAKSIEVEYAITGKYKYMKTTTADYYEMPTPIHELSAESVIFAYPVANTEWRNTPFSKGMQESQAAQNLQKYCTDAGLTPLASEWWHFDDLQTKSVLPEGSRGDYILTECHSATPE